VTASTARRALLDLELKPEVAARSLAGARWTPVNRKTFTETPQALRGHAACPWSRER